MSACERCGKKPDAYKHELHDYCAVCSKNLCRACMARGCCSIVPARSGMTADYSDLVPSEQEGE